MAETLTMDYHRGLNVEVISHSFFLEIVGNEVQTFEEIHLYFGAGQDSSDFQYLWTSYVP